MSWDWRNKIDEFVFADEEYDEEEICPGCGSNNVKSLGQSYEQSDRDDNRGVWIRTLYCRDCQEEYPVYM